MCLNWEVGFEVRKHYQTELYTASRGLDHQKSAILLGFRRKAEGSDELITPPAPGRQREPMLDRRSQRCQRAFNFRLFAFRHRPKVDKDLVFDDSDNDRRIALAKGSFDFVRSLRGAGYGNEKGWQR